MAIGDRAQACIAGHSAAASNCNRIILEYPVLSMTLNECRRFYSEEICLAANVRSPALVDAFARVPREKFLGAGPWRIATPDIGTGASYRTTDDPDPRHLYH